MGRKHRHGITVRHEALDGLSAPIHALGQDDFDWNLFTFLRRDLTADMYSAFAVSDNKEIKYIFAGALGCGGNFPVIASRQYARQFWKSDPLLRNLLAKPSGPQIPLTQRWDQIPSGEYRTFCYENPGVVDRMSLFSRFGRTTILVNLYRYRDSGYFSECDVRQIARYLNVVPSLIVKHLNLIASGEELDLHPPVNSLIYLLESWEKGLSSREIEVCAAMLVGTSLKDISRKLGVELSTTVTYKKRAFTKLGISTRRDLQAFYRRETGIPIRPRSI